MPISMLCLCAQRSITRVAARNNALSNGQLLLKKGQSKVGHGKGDMLPIAVGEDVLLLGSPLLSDFHTAGAAAFPFTAVANVFGVCAMG